MNASQEFVNRFRKHAALQKVRQFEKLSRISAAIAEQEPRHAGDLKEIAADLLDEGIELYDQYTAENPNDDDALSGYGGALRRKGELQGAVEKYKKALEANPQSSYAAVNVVGLCALLGDQGKEDFETYRAKAIRLNQQIIDREEDDNWTWYDAATLQLLDGNLDKALENLELGIARTTAPEHLVSVVSNLNTLREHQPAMRANIDKMLELIRFHRKR